MVNQERQKDSSDPEEHLSEVPAGGAGADSGAVDAVRIDPTDDAEIPDVSAHNKEPGVGTRDARRNDLDT